MNELYEKLGQGSYGCVIKGGYLRDEKCENCITKIARSCDLVIELGLHDTLLQSDPDEKYHCALRGYHSTTDSEWNSCYKNKPKIGGIISIVYTYGGITLDKFVNTIDTEQKYKILLLGLMGLFKTLKWLKNNRIIHGDIKSNNVCVDNNQVRLIDFGISKFVLNPINVLEYSSFNFGVRAPYESFGFSNEYSEHSYNYYVRSMADNIPLVCRYLKTNETPYDQVQESFKRILEDPLEQCKHTWDKFDIYMTGLMLFEEVYIPSLSYLIELAKTINVPVKELGINGLNVIFRGMLDIDPFKRWDIDRVIQQYQLFLDRYVH